MAAAILRGLDVVEWPVTLPRQVRSPHVVERAGVVNFFTINGVAMRTTTAKLRVPVVHKKNRKENYAKLHSRSSHEYRA
jgi:hypothetical protein